MQKHHSIQNSKIDQKWNTYQEVFCRKKRVVDQKLYSMTFGTLKKPSVLEGESSNISWRAKEDFNSSSRKTFFRDVAYAIG